MTRLAPVLRYPGSKHRLAPWIVSRFPAHRVFVDAFCGSLAVFFAMRPSPVSVLNDRDGRLVNLFRVLRDSPAPLIEAIALTPFARDEFKACLPVSDDPVEDARRTLTRCWQSVGSIYSSRTGWKLDTRLRTPAGLVWAKLPARLLAVVERLQGVLIENSDALDLMGRLNEPDVLFYLDPPYLASTRRAALYAEEMGGEAEHAALLTAALAHPGPVVISGYASALYDGRLAGWRRLTRAANALTGAKREEVLWINRPAGRDLFTEEP